MTGEIAYEDKFISIIAEPPKPKTKVFGVQSKCSECRLGRIYYHPHWRHYVFEPISTFGYNTIYSDRCLIAIATFITKLNTERKARLAR
ncbi:hypothetical protein MUP79_03405 [Candidatus Bathyarchaeota archaeon]|nr:hypothetical protein [Candidatus Bathyarchaeota archaeon]